MEGFPPRGVLEYGFDFDWNEEDVWNLDVEVTTIPIDDLAWHFDVPFWDYQNNFYAVTPNEVLMNPEKYHEHYERVVKSDTSYPIDVMENKGRLVILDGLHRLVHLKLDGEDKIRVRIIPRSRVTEFAFNII